MADNVLKLRTQSPPRQMDLFGHYTGGVSKYALFDVQRGRQEQLLQLIDEVECGVLIDTRALCYFLRPNYEVGQLVQEFRLREIFYFSAGTRAGRVANYSEFFTVLRSAPRNSKPQNVVVLFDDSSVDTWMHRAIVRMLADQGRFLPYFGSY